jgi:hypothetical protein
MIVPMQCTSRDYISQQFKQLATSEHELQLVAVVVMPLITAVPSAQYQQLTISTQCWQCLRHGQKALRILQQQQR